jgi:hypothetical protein
MYITGISAFSTVYMELFIQSTLVKTQSLNIMMNSDRKNNYFYSNVNIHYKTTVIEKINYLQECIR